MSKKHVFENHCVDFESILKTSDIKQMLKIVQKQSLTDEAKKRMGVEEYKTHNKYDVNDLDKKDDPRSPVYFGMFVEWYAQEFLNHFGAHYNIMNVNMYDAVGSSNDDYGVDGMGLSMSAELKSNTNGPGITHQKGSPVYLQVKGTVNHGKSHAPNDGSRLPNFTTNAMSSAIKLHQAYQSRYVLFTTAKGIDHHLGNMWNGMVEVIGIGEIVKHTNRNEVFLNILRSRVGLSPIDITIPLIDEDDEEYENSPF